ncbi:MAG: hypothetical protein AAFY42_07285, partial [Pseudomonadota bacterium]
ADRAQSEGHRLERWFKGPDTLRAITPDELGTVARKYLAPENAVEFLVLPQDVPSDEDTIAKSREPKKKG